MTPQEWKDRCAKRYMEIAGVDKETAESLAQTCFEAELEASETPFNAAAEYHPEDCADNDMEAWDG